MKPLLLFFFIIIGLQLNAQVKEHTPSFFDPEHDPVAMRSDTSIQLLVSEYILAKSVKARFSQDCQVIKMYKNKLPNGGEVLVFEGVILSKSRQPFTLGVPLIPDTQGRFLYASTQALVCSAPGCSNCSIQNGNCLGCCSSSTSYASTLQVPLLKVQQTIEE